MSTDCYCLESLGSWYEIQVQFRTALIGIQKDLRTTYMYVLEVCILTCTSVDRLLEQFNRKWIVKSSPEKSFLMALQTIYQSIEEKLNLKYLFICVYFIGG